MVSGKKILFLDIDGTILLREYDTNKRVWRILEEISKKDIVICIVTSRPYAYSSHILNRIPGSAYHIFDRGAYIANNVDFALSITISKDTIRNVYAALEEHMTDIRFGVSSGRLFYANDKYIDEIQGYLETDFFESIENVWTIDGANSIWVRGLPRTALEGLQKVLDDNLSVKLIDQHENKLVDVFIHSKICDKAVFINYLAKINGASLDNAIGIGDSNEDAVFLQKVNKIYCPGNSTPSVKEMANHVANKTASDGLLELLEQIIQ